MPNKENRPIYIRSFTSRSWCDIHVQLARKAFTFRYLYNIKLKRISN